VNDLQRRREQHLQTIGNWLVAIGIIFFVVGAFALIYVFGSSAQ